MFVLILELGSFFHMMHLPVCHDVSSRFVCMQCSDALTVLVN